MNKVQRAIIIAAGTGSRLMPLTQTTPKPLLEIKNKVMIETMIEGFIENEITDIIIVVGYLKEKFLYLKDKYKRGNITYIHNTKYNEANNIYSLYLAREYLGDCIICDGDLILHNKKILTPFFEYSGYCAMYTEYTDKEWLLNIDEEAFITACSRTGGEDGYQLFSVSFWTKEDGKKLRKYLRDYVEGEHPLDIYWDDIPMFKCFDKFKLKIRKISQGDIIEIDTLSELQALVGDKNNE